MRFLFWIVAICIGLSISSVVRAENPEDALFAACVASGTYHGLPVGESETCRCWANVISQHLTSDAAKRIIDGGAVVFDENSYVGGPLPASKALFDTCPGVQAKMDQLNRPTSVPPCRDAFKAHLDAVAIEWACKVDAMKGDAEAQYYMGWAAAALAITSGYEGARPPGPRVDSLEWLRRSANQGYARAQLALGERYAQGDGVTKDEGEAAKWYLLAADQGDLSAQLQLGVLYEYGRGVAKDFTQAYKWYALSAAATRNPKWQAIKNRDYITTKMTPAELAEAQKLVQAWRPQ